MAADVSAPVVVDARQLEQVIVNLALNARDAMPAGGTLTITAQECELPTQAASSDGAAIPAGRYGLIIVRDTGPGMDAATRARIFEPFFTTKPVGQGSGLGLPAAYGIMKQNEGYIAVVSGLGEGTEFSMHLPIAPHAETAERREEPGAPAGEASLHAATILEDEPMCGQLPYAVWSMVASGFSRPPMVRPRSTWSPAKGRPTSCLPTWSCQASAGLSWPDA
ncbi:MAG: hypothetical protein H0T68_06575 [Gemmatimonadales bacterium]|nr:hypothetical protein [Gemmatimonadales bacterium]